jgi:RecB family exonuclease
VEASLGLGGPAAGERFALNSSRPVEVRVGSVTIRAKGRVDRIDRLGDASSHAYAVWDYKCGSAEGYEPDDPFQHGRRLQHFLYSEMVQTRLREAGSDPQARVEQFGYFFPSEREHGERIEWSHADLQEGQAALEQLCQLAHAGTFPPTDEQKDCNRCDYQLVCGDVVSLAAACRGKLDDPANLQLETYRLLRPAKPEKGEKRKAADDPGSVERGTKKAKAPSKRKGKP